MSGLLTGKIALATGGGSGIGRASALAFAREGAKVSVANVDVAGGEETVQMIKDAGGEAMFIKTDVSKTVEVETMVKMTVKIYGRLDCALNNAGIEGSALTKIVDYKEEDWDSVITVNLKGVWLCMKYEIPQMLTQGGGAIVNMSSTAGLVGSAVSSSAYAASKHGVVGLTKTVALEYGLQGIRVNAVCPAITRTPMLEKFLRANPQQEAQLAALSPVGRIGNAEEIAAAVIWLCSNAASYVTGHALAVDGGHVAR